MTAAEGDVDPSPDATVTGIGLTAALAVGTVIVGAANVTVLGQGIQMTAALGQETIDHNLCRCYWNINVTATLNEESVGDATAQLTGIALTMATNSVNALIWNEINTGSL